MGNKDAKMVVMDQEYAHGLRETVMLGDRLFFCSDHKCTRMLRAGDDCYQDADGRLFCEGCGKTLRFHRKKAAQRGETYREGED